MIYDNILEAIGNTPMIRLNKLPKEGSADVYVKMEGLNVGGSIKTRTRSAAASSGGWHTRSNRRIARETPVSGGRPRRRPA